MEVARGSGVKSIQCIMRLHTESIPTRCKLYIYSCNELFYRPVSLIISPPPTEYIYIYSFPGTIIAKNPYIPHAYIYSYSTRWGTRQDGWKYTAYYTLRGYVLDCSEHDIWWRPSNILRSIYLNKYTNPCPTTWNTAVIICIL